MADVELNSIGNGDGTNYLVRDNTKIPLMGTNALSGSIVPDTDNAYNLGSSTKQFNSVYTSNVVNHNTTSELAFGNVTDGANISLCPKEYNAGLFRIQAFDGTTRQSFNGYANGTLTWGSKNVAMQEDTIPRSGGAVMTGSMLGRTVNDREFGISGGTDAMAGAVLTLSGKDRLDVFAGVIYLRPNNGLNLKEMYIYPSGTWTWTGQAVQLISDQRYKQQIAEIDDKLLDAWEDVDLVQFKYNDAVDQKGDNARLHTGYVVQQIDEACKSHNVDISEYGLYCHEVYQEETEEVEVEQEDGTKVKERKVIREASEHYSLRYTEALIVECAYLRKKNKDLQEQLNALSERLEKLENR